MQNWRRNRNFRKQANIDGTTAYIITVGGMDINVREEIYAEYARASRRMEYMELDLKRSRAVQGRNGRIAIDINGDPVILPGRETSLEMLYAIGWDCPSSEPQPDEQVISRLENDALHRCLGLLEADERALIDAIFFDEMTIREYAATTGKTKSSVDRSKKNILGKLKNLLVV